MDEDLTWQMIDAVMAESVPDSDDPEALAQWHDRKAYAMQALYMENLRNDAPYDEIYGAMDMATKFSDEARRLRRQK